MKKSKHILIKLLVVVFTLYFIDGGNSMLLTGQNIQLLFIHDHTIDLEIPHQHFNFNISTDLKGLTSVLYDFSRSGINAVNFIYSLNTVSPEFYDSIWQPPKYV